MIGGNTKMNSHVDENATLVLKCITSAFRLASANTVIGTSRGGTWGGLGGL